MRVTVRQKIKGNGKPWWVFVSHNGKRKSKMIGDKKAAQKVASAIRERLSKGELDLDDERWVEGYIKSMRRVSTFERYQEKGL